MYSIRAAEVCEATHTESRAPLWRSMLFVPATNDRYVRAAARSDADAVILDLEDSIPEQRKSAARECVASAAAELRRSGRDVLVRINQPLRHSQADVAAAVGPDVCALMLPKTLGAQHLALVAESLGELEASRGLTRGATAIVPMIESAAALSRLDEIAACRRVVAMTIGAEDLALSLGAMPVALTLHVPGALVVIAARAAGKLPIGYLGTVAEIDDLSVFRDTVRQARQFGFAGGMCIHPGQIEILNEEFAPTAEEIEAARELIAEFGTGAAEGAGAVRYRGRMVDRPVVDRARALLLLNERIEETARRRV
jgi:citrate lyase subunit beta/citryl-CoA lyase